MKDNISIQRIGELSPYRSVRQTFTDFITECEDTLVVTLRIMNPVYRSIEQQNELYAQGRTTEGAIVTNAKGGTSYHNFGLAVDLCELSQDGKEVNWSFDMGQLEPIAQKYCLEWGGHWVHIKDKPHFELRMEFAENCSDLIVLPRDQNGYVILPDLNA